MLRIIVFVRLRLSNKERKKQTQLSGFFWVFGFLCFFGGFWVFKNIFAQKREFLGFFQFQEYF
jgi:hypothetical protein